jgi:hypothetical protein
MREKLIELLNEAHSKSTDEVVFNCATYAQQLEMESDYLIANGVTIPIRCQDCKHWKNEINGCTEEKRFCDIGFYMVHKNGFCYFGERKTNEFER